MWRNAGEEREPITPEDRPGVTISLVVDEAPTLAEYRASEPDLDLELLVVVDELIEKGRPHFTWSGLRAPSPVLAGQTEETATPATAVTTRTGTFDPGNPLFR